MVDMKLIQWYCCIFTQWGNRVQQAKAASRYAVKVCLNMSLKIILQETLWDVFNTHLNCAVFCRTRCGHAAVRNRCAAGWGGGKIPQRHPVQQCDCQQPTASHAGETDSLIFNYGSVVASLRLKHPDITSRLQSGHHTRRLCDSDRRVSLPCCCLHIVLNRWFTEVSVCVDWLQWLGIFYTFLVSKTNNELILCQILFFQRCPGNKKQINEPHCRAEWRGPLLPWTLALFLILL